VRFSHAGALNCSTPSYATVFYGGQPTLDTATPVAVTAGTATEHIDGVLVPGGYGVSGRVTMGGRGFGGWRLKSNNGAEAMTDADGNYMFTGFYTGTHVIQSVSPFTAISPQSRTVNVPPVASGQDFVLTVSPRQYLPALAHRAN
jgi:hypothetical protein